MGMFTQKPEEKATWAALPGEPLDRDETDLLAAPPAADPFALGLGAPAAGASVAIPLTVPGPADTNGAEPAEADAREPDPAAAGSEASA